MPDAEAPSLMLPLTPYDILGYLAPGGTMILSALAFEHFIDRLVRPQLPHPPTWHTPLLSAVDMLFSSVVMKDNSVSLVLFAIGFVGVAYIAGHVVGSLASLILDRALIYKGYGYPYSYLLKLPRDTNRYDGFSRKFYRGMFFWLNLYFAVRYASMFLAHTLDLGRAAAGFATVADWIGWFLAFAFVMKVVVGSRWTKKWPRLERARLFVARVVGACLDGPYELVASPLAKLMNTRNSFDDQFLKQYRQHFRRAFDLDADSAGTNNYWLCYCYVLERCRELRVLVTHWLRMYVFARNLAAALYCSFLYCFVWLMLEAPSLGQASQPATLGPVLLFPIVLFVSSFLLLIRYYYLFVSYFTKFIFRAFVYAESPGNV